MALCRTKMTSLTGSDIKDPRHLITQDRLLTILEMEVG